jgi:hypothetical protein
VTKILCSLSPLLLFVTAAPVTAQQMGMIDAPDPAMYASVSLAEPAPVSSAAVMPVPSRPFVRQPQTFGALDWGLLGGSALFRFLDYKSTVKCMSDPANFHEVELPNALVHNDPGFAAFEASTVAVNYYAYRLFLKHHHPAMARLGQSINLAAMGWTVGRNYYELQEYWPRSSPGKTLVRH